MPVASALGDQQAALFGQTCFSEGEAKSTYGTGTFLLLNTGHEAVNSYNGLLTTVGYQIGDEQPVYALEGAIAVTGSLVQWMRDQMGLINSAAEIETLASSVEDNGGAYFVPAFSGLFAPYWRYDARGVIAGLTRYVTKAHLARAVLEATAWQTREIVDAMQKDSGVELTALKVDGGMTSNNLLMQTMSDFLDAPVVRPMVAETTCLGAAYAAGLAVGFWSDTDELRANWKRAAEWTPRMDAADRDREYKSWLKAVAADHGLDRRGELNDMNTLQSVPDPRDAPGCRRQPEPRRDQGAARQRDVRPARHRRRNPGHLGGLARRAVGSAGGDGGRRRLRRRHLVRLLQARPRRSALPADRRGEAGGGEPPRAAGAGQGRGSAPGQPAHVLPARLQGRPARRREAGRGRVRLLARSPRSATASGGSSPRRRPRPTTPVCVRRT